MKPWQRIDDGSVVQKVGFRTIVSKRFRMNNGEEMQAYVGGLPDSAASCVVALTPDNQVIIARQFRAGPEKVLDEMPGGLVDPGETPEQAARRELVEESGYEPGSMEYLGASYINAWDNTVHHYFLARNCTPTGSFAPEKFEEIEVVTLPISKFIQNAKEALMTDVQGVLLAYDMLKEIEGEQ